MTNDRLMVGAEKASALLLALSKDGFSKIFTKFNTHEVRELSTSMANLGLLNASTVEEILTEFVEDIDRGVGVLGTYESTRDLLEQCLGSEKMKEIMGEIRGQTAGMWEKLGGLNEDVLVRFLKNEHPQTISLILSKLATDCAAKVLSRFSEDLAVEVMHRMLNSAAVKKDVLHEVERSLQIELMGEFRRSSRRVDPYEVLAEIFNNLDRSTEKKLLGALESADAQAAEKVKSLMFTFEDLVRLDGASIQKVVREADKTILTMALKGASAGVQDLFFSNMSERALKLLKDDIAALGTVRLRDVEEAQLEILTVTKSLMDGGLVNVADRSGSEPMVD